MEDLNVISKVEQPTEWCAGMVVVPKPNGQVRICVDLTKLNESTCVSGAPYLAVCGADVSPDRSCKDTFKAGC